MTATLGDGNALQVHGADGAVRRLAHGQEFYPQRFSASGEVTAPVVFAGFGITAPRWQYDDYSGDVAGKIVLVLDHEPGERDEKSPFEGVVTAEPAAPWRKALAAQEKGAVGILFVADVHNHPGAAQLRAGRPHRAGPTPPPHLKTYTLAAWADRMRIPAAQISPALAASLVAGTGQSLEALAALGRDRARPRRPAAARARASTLRTAVDRHTVPDRNVVGAARGQRSGAQERMGAGDRALRPQRRRRRRRSSTAPTTTDRAPWRCSRSPTPTRWPRPTGQRPKRSVLFAAWNSEERGLLGAWAYTEAPLAPLSSIAGMLNMDMIGRNEEIQVGGGARFAGFEVQTAESNANAREHDGLRQGARARRRRRSRQPAGIGLELKKRYDNNTSNLVRRSDQWPFLQRGVPALGFMTGLHPDYHTVYDRPEKINYAKMEKIARLIHQASWDLANAEARPKSTAQE